jgi:hypothetical protein
MSRNKQANKRKKEGERGDGWCEEVERRGMHTQDINFHSI